MLHDSSNDGAPDDGRFVAPINPTAFCGGYDNSKASSSLYRSSHHHHHSCDDEALHQTEYSTRLRTSIGIKDGVFHYDDETSSPPPPSASSSASSRWDNGVRLWQHIAVPSNNNHNNHRQSSPPPVLTMSPVVVAECATPGGKVSQHDASLAEVTPGGGNYMAGISPRCATPPGQRTLRGASGYDGYDGSTSVSPQWNTPGSIASMSSCAFSPPPRSSLQQQPSSYPHNHNAAHPSYQQQQQHSVSPLSSPSDALRQSTPRGAQGPSVFGTPSRQLGRRDTSPLSRHLSPYAAPPPALLQHTPSKTLRTPVRGLQNSLSPSTGGDGYTQPAALHLTPNRLQTTLPGVAVGGGALGGGGNGSSYALFRRQESMTATRVLDGSGLLRDPVSKPVAYGSVCQLIAALHCTVFQWSPTSLSTLIEAPCAVTAVAASGQGYCVHHYAAVGLENGIIHVFEFNPDRTVRASVMENQLQSRVTCLCLFEEILYCGSDDGVFLAIDVGRLFQLKQQRPADAPPRSPPPRSPPPRSPPSSPPPVFPASEVEECDDAASYSTVVAALPGYMQYRLDIGAPILCMEASDDGNHLALGCGNGLMILHRSQMTHPIHLDDEGPVRALSWAPVSLGLSIIVYASGDRTHSKLVVRSLSGGIKQKKEMFAEIVSLRCCRHTPECVVAHGRSVYPGSATTGAGDDGDLCRLTLFDLQGFRVRKSTRLSGHREDVHFMTLDPQGDILISASMDASIRFWDVSDPNTGNVPPVGNTLRDLLASTAAASTGGGGTGPLRYLMERHQYNHSQYGGSEIEGAMLR